MDRGTRGGLQALTCVLMGQQGARALAARIGPGCVLTRPIGAPSVPRAPVVPTYKEVPVGRNSPIAPYKDLAKLTRGHGHEIEAHKLIEARHLKAWGYTDRQIVNAPSQILTRQEHVALSNKIYNRLPVRKGIEYSRGTVLREYREVYAGRPQYLDAIMQYLEALGK